MSTVNVEAVSRAMGEILAREARTVIYRDLAAGAGNDAGCDLSVTPATAASPKGLLPALVAAGEVVWREATGKGFALDIVRDRSALLDYRLQGVGDGTFTTVMLATMEAIAQIAGPDAIVVNDLNALWAAASDRIERAARSMSGDGSVSPTPRSATGTAP